MKALAIASVVWCSAALPLDLYLGEWLRALHAVGGTLVMLALYLSDVRIDRARTDLTALAADARASARAIAELRDQILKAVMQVH